MVCSVVFMVANRYTTPNLRFTWYCTQLDSRSPGPGFIPIISTKGKNQIKKGNCKKKIKFYMYIQKDLIQIFKMSAFPCGCNSKSTLILICLNQPYLASYIKICKTGEIAWNQRCHINLIRSTKMDARYFIIVNFENTVKLGV